MTTSRLPSKPARKRTTKALAGVVAVSLTTLAAPSVVSASPVSASPAASPKVSYTYDGDGRLHTVTSTAGMTSTYSYDADGNITAISKPVKAGVSPAAASRRTRPRPELGRLRASARTGSELVVPGRHFSVDPDLDKVSIGQLIAPVLRASATSLTVRVPPGPGGPVKVLTPAGLARGGHVTIKGAPAPPPAVPTHPPGTGPAPRAPAGSTALAGRVETASGRPLAGVRVSISGAWGATEAAATTGKSGWFLLAGLTGGKHQVVVDAASVGGRDYGTYVEPVQVPRGRTTVLPWITYLSRIDTAHAVTVPSPTTRPVVVTNPKLPGVEVRIPAGTVIRDRNGQVIQKLSLTPLPLDRTPFPLAPGMPVFFTLQPGDATFSGHGVQVTYANVTHLPAGSKVSYVALNPAWGSASWYSYGTGRVSANGKQIVPGKRAVFKKAIPLGYNPLPPPPAPPPPDGQMGGEPVDLFTGLYEMNATDLTLPDGLPAALTRTYRDQDGAIHGFGVGMEAGYDWFVTPNPAISGDYSLVRPDGSRIDYTPASAPGEWNAVGAPGQFAGSLMIRGQDDIATFTIKLKDGTSYVFGALPGLLIRQTNLYGASLVISRAPGGNIEAVTTPGGKWMKFTYGPCLAGFPTTQCITQVTDDAGRTVSYTYDASARLTGVTDAGGGHTSYAWAPCTSSLSCTELLTITDPDGITALQNTYSSTGQIVSQTDADGGQWQYSYGINGPNDVTTVTDPRGVNTVWDFGPNGYPASETAAAGTSSSAKTTFAYDAANLLTSTTDPLGRKTTYTYDSLGNLTSVTELAGTPQAAKTTLTYEPAFNRIASLKLPGQNATTWSYNDKNRTITETDPLHNKTVITASPASQPVEVTDSLGHHTFFSYYDGDLVTIVDPAQDATSGFYDGAGNLLQATDPQGQVTETSYNPLGEVTSVTDPLGKVTHLGYDADGSLTSVTDPENHATTYTYTSMLQVASATDPLGHKSSYRYDLLGNLTKVTDRNGIADTFAYDPLDRLTKSVYDATAKTGQVSIDDAYDKAGRLTSATQTGTGTDALTYDGLDDILSATSPQGTVSYTYNSAGQRLTMTASGQAQVKYAYNADGLISGITQGASKVSFGYDADLRVTSVGLPDGITRTDTYDQASRLSGIAYKSAAGSLGSLSYAYTRDGQVASVGGTLAAVSSPTPVTSATFNADNELTSQNGTAYSYDHDGNLLSDGTSTYRWNPLGELAQVTGPGTTSYAYDALGRQATMTTGGVITSNLYDGGALVKQSTPSATTGYLSGGLDNAYQETTSAGATTLLTAREGSVIGLAGPNDKITTKYVYTPGGSQSISGTKSKNTLGFMGAPAGPRGLTTIGMRTYSPSTTRYIIQGPPQSVGGGLNPYQFDSGNPINVPDPAGPGFASPFGPGDGNNNTPGGDSGGPGASNGGGAGSGAGGGDGGGGGGGGGPGAGPDGGGSCSSGMSDECGSGDGNGPGADNGQPGGNQEGGGNSEAPPTDDKFLADLLGLAGLPITALAALVAAAAFLFPATAAALGLSALILAGIGGGLDISALLIGHPDIPNLSLDAAGFAALVKDLPGTGLLLGGVSLGRSLGQASENAQTVNNWVNSRSH